MIKQVEYERQGESQKFTVRITTVKPTGHFTSLYYGVSLYSVDRLHRWLDKQYPRVYGGGNYYGSYYTVKS